MKWNDCLLASDTFINFMTSALPNEPKAKRLQMSRRLFGGNTRQPRHLLNIYLYSEQTL
jgi:hypothetical protein